MSAVAPAPGPAAAPAPHTSIVIPALNEGENLIDTVAVVRSHSGIGAAAPEIIVVDDGSTDSAPQRIAGRYRDDPLIRVIAGPGEGIARARNAGAQAARGEIIVFLDGHCWVPPGWLAPLLDPFADAAVAMTGPAFRSIRDLGSVACGITWADAGLGNIWLPGTTSGPVPFHIGACQAVRASSFADCGGFDAGMTRWGSEDIELCVRLWLLGHEVHAAPASIVHHLFRTSRPYDVDLSLILYNHLRLAVLHFDEARLAKVLAQMMPHEGADKALAKAMLNGVMRDREALHARRVHDIDWLFARFGIGF